MREVGLELKTGRTRIAVTHVEAHRYEDGCVCLNGKPRLVDALCDRGGTRAIARLTPPLKLNDGIVSAAAEHGVLSRTDAARLTAILERYRFLFVQFSRENFSRRTLLRHEEQFVLDCHGKIVTFEERHGVPLGRGSGGKSPGP